jgi:hypothetical protein
LLWKNNDEQLFLLSFELMKNDFSTFLNLFVKLAGKLAING